MSDERLYRNLYGKALRYLGMRLRSEQEMRNKLEVWVKESDWSMDAGRRETEDGSWNTEVRGHRTEDGEWKIEDARNRLGNDLVERVFEQLKRERFLDDERFAKEWIISRLKRGKRGPGVIKMELKQKGIGEELVRKVLAEVEHEEVGVSELEGAMRTAEKYLRKLDGRDVREQKMKLYAYLRGKGFSGSVVAGIVKELFSAF